MRVLTEKNGLPILTLEKYLSSDLSKEKGNWRWCGREIPIA